MTCGISVVCSNVFYLPKVVGNAGTLVDPLDIDELSEAILRLESSENLRKSMLEKGIVRAAMFS